MKYKITQVIANIYAQNAYKRMYEAKLTAMGFTSENIRKYGFAFKGKECLIGNKMSEEQYI